MKQSEIFWSHTRNSIKKKQLFLFSFFFFFFIRKSANTAERLDESGENSAERREVLSGWGERTQMCRAAQWAAERLLSVGTSLFPGKYCQVWSFLPWDTTHELSLSADRYSFLARPSELGLGWHCQLLSWLLNFPRTDKLSSGSRARHRALLLCHWPDIVIFSHLKTNALAANLYFHRHFSPSISI